MAFYEVYIQASQMILVEADTREEAVNVACDNYLDMNFEFDEARIVDECDEDAQETYSGQVILK